MIIAAYAGTGKSTFAAQTEDTVDLPIMPYRWILPPIDKPPAKLEELEREKGAIFRLADPRFPLNYLAEILKAERAHKFVLIPTNGEVILRLQEDYGRNVLLCYPEDACREEYRKRFLSRGNSDCFLTLFIDGWNRVLDPLRENGRGVHIVMGPGTYLADLQRRFEEERRADTTEPVPEETIRALEGKAADIRKNAVLCVRGVGDDCFYPITDLDAPEEREFLHGVGQMIYNSRWVIASALPMDCAERMFSRAFLTQDHSAVKAFIEKTTESIDKSLNRKESIS